MSILVTVAILVLLWPQGAGGEEVRAKELFYSSPSQTNRVDGKSPERDMHTPVRPTTLSFSSVPNKGLKCWIELMGPDQTWQRVSPIREFHSGERVRIHVQSNVSGRLTIFQQQDSLAPEVLFPDRRLREGDDSVEALKDVAVSLKFDETPGRIRLLLFLRRGAPDIAPAVKPSNRTAISLLREAETISRSKGLKLDLEDAGPDPALFIVRPGLQTDASEGVATELVLIHKRR